MKCKECCGDGYNLRIIKKGNGYTTERVTCEHCNGTGEVSAMTYKDVINEFRKNAIIIDCLMTT